MAKQSDSNKADVAPTAANGVAFGSKCRYYMTIASGAKAFIACRCPQKVEEGKAWLRDPVCEGCAYGEQYPDLTQPMYTDRSEEAHLREG
jgi:hypothetical protein